ncbi:MAG: glyoxalase [SAR86 cluster bacterium]|uniref:Glyoxalase n=1 Tax=SAR86 cluster bacterium TaxID=2030880 RepID=A0A2A5CIB2_9GAMM|nr:VOC family protein [Gammaproteobacteria bacterium AH-315-E17]PCJ43522.1 MAG: glyoxalase [SAR86 cluster bacterium]
MLNHEKINYVEFASANLPETKRFFIDAFDWSFEDFGPDYTAFSNAGLDGGFYKADLSASASKGSALIIFYSNDLEKTQEKIVNAGGVISKDVFPFPGGRRFEFTEPAGNEFAVWSDLGI